MPPQRGFVPIGSFKNSLVGAIKSEKSRCDFRIVSLCRLSVVVAVQIWRRHQFRDGAMVVLAD